MQFVVASHNHDKIKELQQIFRVCNNEVIPYTDLLPKIKFPPEGNYSYEENASDKALFISKFLPDRLIIADDSGLLLTARPKILGVRTARDLTNLPHASPVCTAHYSSCSRRRSQIYHADQYCMCSSRKNY